MEGVEFRAKVETARDVIVCTECSKPRCLHSLKLSLDEKKHVANIKEDTLYVCGASVTTPDTPLFGKIGVRCRLTCSAEISYHYFSSKRFPLVCFVCGAPNAEKIAPDLKERYQTVHPVCTSCPKDGKKERVRRELKVGRSKGSKRKHH